MNLLLLEPAAVSPDGTTTITDQRVDHVRRILKLEPGDTIDVGVVGGRLGSATILELSRDCLQLSVETTKEPPPPLDVVLVLALPRPKFLGRILQAATTLGVKRLILLQTERVQRSYWQSSVLEPGSIDRHLRLGLEQARDTILPEVERWPSWPAFVAERLPRLLDDRTGIVAHEDAAEPFVRTSTGATTLFVGPEGGLLDPELATLEAAGATSQSLGQRTLRVETAVSCLLGRLLPS